MITRVHAIILTRDADAVREVEGKGVEVSRPVSEERWRRLAVIRMPDGNDLRLYQPTHPRPE